MTLPTLTNEAVVRLVELRHRLHRTPELAGREAHTAAVVGEWLAALRPDDLQRGLGGHGVLATFRGASNGPGVLIRAELDALPIAESLDLPYASRNEGCAHKCGHDGHMAVLAGVALQLAEFPLRAGSISLLFQPAEETGEGALRVLDDLRRRPVPLDFALAIHNLPGFEPAKVLVREGTFALASVGAEVEWSGRESHAGEPEKGLSPASALAATLQAIAEDSSAEADEFVTAGYARLGTPGFGTSPGSAVLHATLRAPSDERLATREAAFRRTVEAISTRSRVPVKLAWCERFPATVCDPGVVRVAAENASAQDLNVESMAQPFRWSEDFGHFLRRIPGALIGLGAGRDHPGLHDPAYDFPDSLIPVGARLLGATARDLIARTGGGR